ncbi:uncharacterized [Tachysurus ichikawai]
MLVTLIIHSTPLTMCNRRRSVPVTARSQIRSRSDVTVDIYRETWTVLALSRAFLRARPIRALCACTLYSSRNF